MDIIEGVIKLYCQRFHFDQDTLNRLINKYGEKGYSKPKQGQQTERTHHETVSIQPKTDRERAPPED